MTSSILRITEPPVQMRCLTRTEGRTTALNLVYAARQGVSRHVPGSTVGCDYVTHQDASPRHRATALTPVRGPESASVCPEHVVDGEGARASHLYGLVASMLIEQLVLLLSFYGDHARYVRPF